MIKANELRIGNWVELNNSGLIKVEADNIGDIINNPAIFTPIPLTPEILEKCGFEKVPNKKIELYCYPRFSLNNNISIYFFPNTLQLMDEDLNTYWIMTCEYLHTLQNLYFALTGEELIINL